MTIPTEAIEAGARAIWARHWPGLDYNAEATIQEHARCHRDATAALTDAAPHIQAAALRDAESVVDAELQDAPPPNYEEDNYDAGYIAGLTYTQDLLRARAEQLEGKTNE